MPSISFKFTKPQTQIIKCKARFVVVPAGRRFGKTKAAVEKILQKASASDKIVWYVAPTYKQAKNIAWAMLLRRLKPLNWIEKINNVDLEVTLVNGSTISLKGANNPDSLRGVGVHFMIIDEAADIDEDVWIQVLRPMLADTLGEAWFIGTPKGRNWFYTMYQRGLDVNEPDYQSFHFTTLQGGNVTPKEIEDARRDMDELSFKQEFEADFTNFKGRTYYPFNYEDHVTPLKYDENKDLIFCFDFNAAPGVAVVCQEQVLFHYKGEDLVGTGCINEVHIPQNSTTINVCNKLVQMYRNHKGKVICYGDATGAAGGSAKVSGSDWDLIKSVLKPIFQGKLSFDVPDSNPRERVRVNSVNTRLRNAEGQIRMLVDPKCKHLILDFDGVRNLEGGSGEIDKKVDPALTHITDALGYYIVKKFPIIQIEKSRPVRVIGRY